MHVYDTNCDSRNNSSNVGYVGHRTGFINLFGIGDTETILMPDG